MYFLLVSLVVGVLIVSGCAKRPQVELEIVRAEVSKAYANRANVLAEKDYAAATQALKKAEELVFQEEYESARLTLNQALLSAARATELAQTRAIELEAQRVREALAQAAAKKQALAEVQARPVAPPLPKPVVIKPPPQAPAIILLDQVTVSVGETLFSLSSRRDIYGEPLLWPLIYKANRDQIKDPQQIYEGQVLSIPRDKNAQEMEAARKEARESNLFPR